MRIIFCLFIHLTCSIVYAQHTGNISGKVLDSISMPVEFANVFISAKSDSAKIVSGTITDSTGYFSLSNISFGEYYLYIQFIGFAKYKQSVVLNQENINISLPNIVLKSDVSVLHKLAEQLRTYSKTCPEL